MDEETTTPALPSPENTDQFFMPASHEELQQSIDHAIKHKSLPQYLRSKDARKAFQSAFELIGGIPRLALWADKNPTQFYQLYARFLEQPQGGASAPPPIHLHLSWMNGRALIPPDEIVDVEANVPDSSSPES